MITLPLHPGETVLWVGSPVPGFHRRGATVFLMLFGLPFLIIGVGLFFYGLMQLHKSATMSDAGLALFTAAFALTFGSFGAFLVFGPLIAARTAFRDVRYALTNRAAYVVRQGRFPSLKVYPILPTTALELEPGRRAGTVWLHARLERDSDGDLGTTKAGFENIAEADKVFGMIRDLQGKTA
ncbi:hypothetical protein [Tabrizicola sp.]|uniref:hypothetical protein n=1 Tax=Tabrizicola sp. TaxID=2005166 RepID=UPI0025EBA281|nr:hypothetical protein [Tabrizicola sp.]